jgi:endonuclease/exonuclease/phosphatase family metal-dependent hydrolase
MRWLIALLLLAQVSLAEQVTIITWNLKWFPGGGKTSTPAERIVHMSAAKDALMGVSPDVICAQEIRNWEAFAELATIRPDLVPNVVSAYRDSPQGGAISIQQIGIASRMPAVGAWSEAFRVAPESPPRGFSFVALQLQDGRHLLVYSVHLKSNLGDLTENIARREEAAEQLVAHAAKMEEAYRPVAAAVICGDFNTDPTGGQFAEEKTFNILESAGFIWPWRNTPLAERITLPSSGRFPDACFDGFVVKGDMRVVSCEVLPIDGVSDHKPVKLVLE